LEVRVLSPAFQRKARMAWRVECGDCLELLRQLPDGSVDVVVTDPPYGISYQSARRTDKSKWKPKIANDGKPYIWWMHDAARLLKDGGRLLCFCRWDTAEAFRLAIEWSGLTVRSQIIWDRESHGMGDPRVSPSPRHDVVWYATKGRYEFANGRPCSVVRSMRLSGSALVHPNEKPVDLMEQLIGSYSVEGETVLDPFAGSGTTGVACVQTGRNFIGFEIDPHYCEIARKRISEAEASQKV
jgi:site-specific DNA-methyltransferase (adenine-specific)